MDFALNDEQKMMIATVRSFIAEEQQPLEDEVEQQGFLAADKAKAIHVKARALVLYAMNISEQFGGGGLSELDTMLMEEQFGHTTDILIRRAFGNVYEVLLEPIALLGSEGKGLQQALGVLGRVRLAQWARARWARPAMCCS